MDKIKRFMTENILAHTLQMLFLLSIATILGLLFRYWGFPETNVVLLYLTAVLLTAWLTSGYGYGVLASFLATAIFNYFFTSPYHSLNVDNPSYVITFVIMTLTAFFTSTLTSKAKMNANRALRREEEIKTIYMLSRRLNEEIDFEGIAQLAAEILSSSFETEISCLCLDEHQVPTILLSARPHQDAVQLPLEQFPITKQQKSQKEYRYLPLQNKGILLAVLRIRTEVLDSLNGPNLQLLQSLNETITLAMDRFRTTQKQIRSEEEISRERYKSNLLRAISHDLRTPLSAIMGTSEIISDMSPDNDPRHDLAKGIYQDAEWLHSLVENILSLTRLQDSSVNLHKEVEAAEEIIASALEHFSKRAPDRTVNVSIPDEVLMVPMDGKLIQQVLINLLDNALKHTKKEDAISLTLVREGHEAVFTVSDEGEGIDEKDLPHLFQTFYTTRNKQADSEHGIGLGLSICETIVKAHSGSISASNRTDRKGACFTFRLPLEDKQ